MKIDLNDIRIQLKQIPPEELARHGVISLAKTRANGNPTAICPLCGNGEGDSGDGIAFVYEDGGYLGKCFKCGEWFDNIKLLGLYYGLNDSGTDFKEILKRAAVEFGIADFDNSPTDFKSYHNLTPIKTTQQVNPVKEKTAEEIQRDLLIADLIQQDIKLAQDRLSELPKNQRRGLTLDTLKFFGCGFLNNWVHPLNVINGKNVPPSRRLIIPAGNHYNAVALPADRPNMDKKYWKMHAGTKFPFGLDLFDAQSIFIITEGEIDAMSIFQSTDGKFNVIAVSGAAGYNDFIKLLKDKYADTFPKPEFLILFDSNDAGRLNAPKFQAGLIAAKFPAVCDFLFDYKTDKDFNDILREEGEEKLSEIVQSLVDKARAGLKQVAEKIKEDSELIKDSRADENDNDNYFKEREKSIAADEKAFEEEKTAAIEQIKKQETFSNDVILREEIFKAMAFCKIYSPFDYSRLLNDIADFNKKTENAKQKVDLTYLKSSVTDYVKEIKNREAEIKHRRAVLTAEKKSVNFISKNDFLNNIKIPEPFTLNEKGIFKVIKGGIEQVSYVPVVVSRKVYSLENNTSKFALSSYQNSNGKWREVPPVPASVIADKKNLPALADEDLPFDSSNAYDLVKFLNAYKFLNNDSIPIDFSVSRCGWFNYNGQDYFVDPRRPQKIFNPDILRTGNLIPDSNCFLANHLKQSGSVEEWKKAFDAASSSPLAVFMCYLATAPFLLKILDKRNFVFYIHGRTRGGKTTSLLLATSIVGTEKLMFTFDATTKVIPELAANYSDYVLPMDEKQLADSNLKNDFAKTIYALASGVGRIKLNKDSTIRIPKDWSNITLATGETPLIDDVPTGGVLTRLFSIPSPEIILDAETCSFIRKIIKKNYGVVSPIVLNIALEKGTNFINERFENVLAEYKRYGKNILPEYLEYIAVGMIGGMFLHMALGDSEKDAHFKALKTGGEMLQLAPTLDQISDVGREKEMIREFIAVNQSRFEGGNVPIERINGKIWGKLNDPEYILIAPDAIRTAQKERGIGGSYKKVVEDLVADGYLIVGKDSLPEQKWIGGFNGRYFKILKSKF